MNRSRYFQAAPFLVGLMLLNYGCKHTPDPVPTPPTVGFGPTADVRIGTRSSAQVSSTITAIAINQPLTVGHVWSAMNPLPTVVDNKTAQTVSIASTPYSLTSTLTNLTLQALYYVRAYVTTPAGTAYGPVTTFQMKPTVAMLLAGVLDDSLRGRNIGYGFVIFENDVLKASGQGGLKSRAVDAEGEKPFTIDTKMHIASMSKTIAAMAFVQLAAQKGLKTTDKIAPYLPPSWPKGDNIDQITFRDLFNHRSGIIGLADNCRNGAFSENIYPGLKQLIGKGVIVANRGQYCYQNANVGLFRVLIPALTGYSFTGNDVTDDQQTWDLYQAYVQKNVFEKVGLTGVIPVYPAGDPTYTYDYPYSGRKGWNPGGFTQTLGAYGWYLTPREAGTLYASVLSSPSETVLPTAYKDTLLLKNLGCFHIASTIGDVAYHDGLWYENGAAPYTGLRTIWMKLPNNLTVALLVNALNRQRGIYPSNDGTDIVVAVFRAYDRARQAAGGRTIPATMTLEHPEPH